MLYGTRTMMLINAFFTSFSSCWYKKKALREFWVNLLLTKFKLIFFFFRKTKWSEIFFHFLPHLQCHFSWHIEYFNKVTSSQVKWQEINSFLCFFPLHFQLFPCFSLINHNFMSFFTIPEICGCMCIVLWKSRQPL